MQPTYDRRQLLWLIPIFLLLTAVFPYMPGHPYDNLCWQSWSKHIFRHGLSRAYLSDTNYLPFYQYILWLFGKLAGSEQGIEHHFRLLRCFTLLFECWGLWMVWKWGRLKISYIALVVIGLANIGYSYNTVVWGQADAISAALVFAALYAGVKRRYLWSGVALVLAVNMKLQVIIFTPVWGLLLVHQLTGEGRLQAAWRIILAMAAVQVLLVLPFALAGIAGIKPIWNILRNSSGYFSELSLNAYNLWYWVVPDPTRVRDTVRPFGPISYKTLGLALFMASSFFALLPLLRKVLAVRKGAATAICREELWLSAALVGVLFFFCNTEMHERYSHPAFLFITAYAFYTRRFAVYILFSVATFLNLEGVIHWLDLGMYDRFFFKGGYVALLYLAVIIYLFFMLYRKRSSRVVLSSEEQANGRLQGRFQPVS